MMPSKMKRKFSTQVVPSDANLILITNSQYEHLASALPLVLSAEDSNCRLVCAPDTAERLLRTNMVN